jgi:hypothetical protein
LCANHPLFAGLQHMQRLFKLRSHFDLNEFISQDQWTFYCFYKWVILLFHSFNIFTFNTFLPLKKIKDQLAFGCTFYLVFFLPVLQFFPSNPGWQTQVSGETHFPPFLHPPVHFAKKKEMKRNSRQKQYQNEILPK